MRSRSGSLCRIRALWIARPSATASVSAHRGRRRRRRRVELVDRGRRLEQAVEARQPGRIDRGDRFLAEDLDRARQDDVERGAARHERLGDPDVGARGERAEAEADVLGLEPVGDARARPRGRSAGLP